MRMRHVSLTNLTVENEVGQIKNSRLTIIKNQHPLMIKSSPFISQTNQMISLSVTEWSRRRRHERACWPAWSTGPGGRRVRVCPLLLGRGLGTTTAAAAVVCRAFVTGGFNGFLVDEVHQEFLGDWVLDAVTHSWL